MMQENLQWLGDVYYRTAEGCDMYARAALLCRTRADFDEILIDYFERRNASLLWTEEVHSVLHWFNKFGHNIIMASLVRKVNAQFPVALSEPKMKEASPDEIKTYFNIDYIENVEPLDSQFGVWTKRSVPETLQDVMFGQPDEAGSPPLFTYAILDAAKMPYLLTSFLGSSELEYQSLFQGKTQDDLKEHAPYIVKLEEGNDFTCRLFTSKKFLGLWERELGIFIRSHATLSELRKHFRKFTRIQNNQGKWYYFRFWEKNTLLSMVKAENKLSLSIMFLCQGHMIKLITPDGRISLEFSQLPVKQIDFENIKPQHLVAELVPHLKEHRKDMKFEEISQELSLLDEEKKKAKIIYDELIGAKYKNIEQLKAILSACKNKGWDCFHQLDIKQNQYSDYSDFVCLLERIG